MKKHLISGLISLTHSPRLLWLLVALLFLTIAAIIYIGVTIEASELRVVTHYSAYGIQHFYRDQWVYLLGFIGFILINAVIGIGAAIKLLREEREPLAVLMGWVAIGMTIITLTIYTQINTII